MTIREAMRSPTCYNCGGAAVLGEVSLEEQHLGIENSRLKDELDRVCALAGKFLGCPVSVISSPLSLPLPLCSGLDLTIDSNNDFMGMEMQSIPDLMGVGSAAMRLPAGMMGGGLDDGLDGEGISIDRSGVQRPATTTSQRRQPSAAVGSSGHQRQGGAARSST
ncbi:hypothetical protein ZWY2020_026571 [Hordeum vulgare]|nr:hypothetical protein ZWY2020_026571 [Hordeum vulgare]